MGRPIRIQYPGALYHIISRENERNKIFLNDAELIGGIHYSTVSKVSAWLRAEMVKDKELSKLTNRLDSHFNA